MGEPGTISTADWRVVQIRCSSNRNPHILTILCNSASAVLQIIRLYHNENSNPSTDQVTKKDLNPAIRAFLFRRGTQNPQDIQKIADIEGLWPVGSCYS
ncbi:uncharacterized protein BDV14DRAFT_177450 [Aspergillus stella-maris]|uniref:uncharacterized protein n=1 Tax=Aspergillus stella-maris TaxID=1810926 RepID=UPI003CCD3849